MTCRYLRCDTFGGTHEWVRYCGLTMCECNGLDTKCDKYKEKYGG